MLRRDGPTLNGLTRNGVVEFKASGVASRGEESRSREGRYQSEGAEESRQLNMIGIVMLRLASIQRSEYLSSGDHNPALIVLTDGNCKAS